MLDNFDTGWRNTFEPYIQYLITLFPEARLENVSRHNGLLRIKLVGTDENMQYILDCVTHKIERDSARTCEKCASYGLRRLSEHLDEAKCLCFTCYVHEVDSILNKQ